MNAKPLLLAALLGGCATTPHNLQQDLAQSAIPAAWMFQNSDRAANSHREWWRDYGSAALDQLITRGLAHNQNLAAAGYAWQKSRIALENSDANRGADYSGGVNASAGRNLSHGGHTNQNYGSSLGINYQADLWGKLRLASDNAAWESQATAEDLLATRLSLIGDIINQYLQIASLNDQLALNAAYRKNAAQTLDLTRTKVHAGSASPLDLREAEQNRTNLDANRDRLENQRQQAETTLASLLGAGGNFVEALLRGGGHFGRNLHLLRAGAVAHADEHDHAHGVVRHAAHAVEARLLEGHLDLLVDLAREGRRAFGSHAGNGGGVVTVVNGEKFHLVARGDVQIVRLEGHGAGSVAVEHLHFPGFGPGGRGRMRGAGQREGRESVEKPARTAMEMAAGMTVDKATGGLRRRGRG